jgi:hypothetical protein
LDFVIQYSEKTREHNILETGYISVLRWRGGDICFVGSLRKGPDYVKGRQQQEKWAIKIMIKHAYT